MECFILSWFCFFYFFLSKLFISSGFLLQSSNLFIATSSILQTPTSFYIKLSLVKSIELLLQKRLTKVRFPVTPNQKLKEIVFYSFLCLTLSNEKERCVTFTVGGKQAGKWQLDSTTARSLGCLSAKVN